MRMRRKCLVLTLSSLVFVVLHNLTKLFYLNYFDVIPWFPEPFPIIHTNISGKSSPKVSPFIKRCRVGNVKNCLKNVNRETWVNNGIPAKGEYPVNAFPGEGKHPSQDKTHPKSSSEMNLFSQNKLFEVEMPTPKGFVEISKTNVKNMKRRKPPPGVFPVANPRSPAKLKIRLESFSKDSEVVKFVEKQNKRILFEKAYCSREFNITSPRHRNQHGFESILVDREYCITFCPIYKAASTSWLVNLLTLKGMWNPGRKRPKVQRLVDQVFQKVSTLVAPWVSRSTTKFMIVRHPFERLISCYRDKFEDASKFYYYERYGEKMVQMHRPHPPGVSRDKISLMVKAVRKSLAKNGTISLHGNPFANPIGPTFEEFAKYVVNARLDDEHWRPYFLQCSVCHMNYDFILRFENIKADSRLLAEYLNLTSILKIGWENPTSDGTTTSAVVCSYLKQIDMDLMNKLINKYKDDFSLFLYSPNDYIKCVKDFNLLNNKL